MAAAIKNRSQQLELSGVKSGKSPVLKGRLALNAQLYGAVPAKPIKPQAPKQLVEPSISNATTIRPSEQGVIAARKQELHETTEFYADKSSH